MEIKFLVDEDICNYKKISMFIGFPYCTFKCGREVCQNVRLAAEPNIKISKEDLVDRYIKNPLTNAIVMGGLEPFLNFFELLTLISEFRKKTDDDIVIYTGYKEEELLTYIKVLKQYPNIIIKFGRYVPNQNPHYDETLGVNLISDNQYARRIS